MFVPGSHDLLLSSHEVVRWNPDTDRVLWRVPGERAGDLALVGRDTLLFAHDSAVSLVRVADGTSIAELPGSAGARYNGLIGMDHCERNIIAGGLDRRMHGWNADSGAELLAFTVPALPRKIVIDPSSARIAILAGRGGVVWTVPAFPGTLDDPAGPGLIRPLRSPAGRDPPPGVRPRKIPMCRLVAGARRQRK